MVTVDLDFYIFAQELKDKNICKKIVFYCFGRALASFNGIFQVVTGRDFIRGYQPILNIGL